MSLGLFSGEVEMRGFKSGMGLLSVQMIVIFSSAFLLPISLGVNS